MTQTLIRPIAGTPPIGDTFQDHVNRGSVNPGTDYKVAKNTPVRAVKSGRIMVADSSNDGSGGRTLVLWDIDGGSSDFLHLQSLAVGVGSVTQGQIIGYSGGSGYGRDNYYGNHLHWTYRPKSQITWEGNVGNVNGEAYITGSGSSGVDHATLWDQQRLNVWRRYWGLAPILEDGIRGKATIAAIEDAQARFGIKVDGIAGAATDGKLGQNPPAVTPNPAPSKRATIKKGSTGANVKLFQQTMNARYPSYSHLAVDGKFGTGTESVAKEFQRRAGLVADGVIGPKSWGYLGL